MIRRVCKLVIFKLIYPLCYFFAGLKRVRSDKVIFVENHQDTLSDNFTLLYRELEKQGYSINVHYLGIAASDWKTIIVKTLKMLADMATARCVFICESNSVFGSIHLKKNTELVQLWHACGAFKKWGFSVSDKGFGEDEKELSKYNGHHNYTLVPVSGKAVCFAYEEAFGLQEKSYVIKPLGVSKTDVFFSDKAISDAREKLKSLDIKLNNRKVILYAPTFRGTIKEAETPDYFIYNDFYEHFHDDYVLLIKQHPFVKAPVAFSGMLSDSIVEIGTQMTIQELLVVADICITDYSSIIFEYSLMEKPMVFFASDVDDYYDERGFYYSYEDFVPGPIVKSMQELIESIEHVDEIDTARIKEFRNLYMDGCDGHATERILKEIFG